MEDMKKNLAMLVNSSTRKIRNAKASHYSHIIRDHKAATTLYAKLETALSGTSSTRTSSTSVQTGGSTGSLASGSMECLALEMLAEQMRIVCREDQPNLLDCTQVLLPLAMPSMCTDAMDRDEKKLRRRQPKTQIWPSVMHHMGTTL